MSASPEIKIFEAELAADASAPLKISNEFLLTRGLLRDVPDEVRKKLFENAEQSNVRSNVVISATARAPDQAVKLARLGIEFLRWVLVQRALMNDVQEWQNARDLLASLDAKLLQKEAAVASIDRSIGQMAKLQNGEAPGPLSAPAGSVQIQVNGATYLPPGQQIIGLQSKRIDDEEELKKIADEKARIEKLQSFGTELASLLGTDPDPLKVLDSALARAETLRAQATSLPEQEAYDHAISRLALAKKTYVDLKPSPAAPYVHRTGLGLASSIAIGGGAGLLLWMAFLYILHLWEAEQATKGKEQPSSALFPVANPDGLQPQQRIRMASVEYDR